MAGFGQVGRPSVVLAVPVGCPTLSSKLPSRMGEGLGAKERRTGGNERYPLVNSPPCLPSCSENSAGSYQTDYISILLTKLLAAVERTQLSREVGAIRLCICNTNYFRCFLIYECVMFLAAFYHRLSEWMGCVGMCFWLKSYYALGMGMISRRAGGKANKGICR